VITDGGWVVVSRRPAAGVRGQLIRRRVEPVVGAAVLPRRRERRVRGGAMLLLLRSPGSVGGGGLDALDEAGHPEVAHDVLELLAVDVALELLGVLLHARAPVVLDLVVGAPREVLRDLGPAVAPARVQLQDEQLLLRCDAAAPEVGAEVVEPPEPAALASALQPCITGTN